MSIARARTLRQKLSPPEAKMWNVLRRAPFHRHHFRRQVPIGPFYADFASHEAKLVIEIDGAQHFEDEAQRLDATRSAFIASEGYDVIRFNTVEVLNHLDSVGAALLARLPEHP
jgi:very-short-patch-repair endonuclease